MIWSIFKNVVLPLVSAGRTALWARDIYIDSFHHRYLRWRGRVYELSIREFYEASGMWAHREHDRLDRFLENYPPTSSWRDKPSNLHTWRAWTR